MYIFTPLLSLITLLFCLPLYIHAEDGKPVEDRKIRPDGFWQDYMHGISDSYANSIDMKAVCEADPKLKKYIVQNSSLKSRWKNSDMPVLKADASKSFSFPFPLPMEKVRGKKIRIFFWMKGQNIGDGLGWHSANIVFKTKKKNGDKIYAMDSFFHTQGSFPWHCYYREFFIPANTESAELQFYNTFKGTAYFTCPSWELVEGNAVYVKDELQDPETGSMAPNVRFDQMPEHLRSLATKYQWNFLKGNLPGQPYAITSRDGLEKYYYEKAKKCPEHMNHAVLYLGEMYYKGTDKKLIPDLEEGWLDKLREILMKDQDTATGYWHDGKDLSLGLTFHLCNMFFRYYDLKRSDRADIINESMGLVNYVPNADKIVAQTLRQQSSRTDENGKYKLAAWNKEAYRYTNEPDKDPSKSYLGSTWDAIYLLRLSGRFTDEETQKKIYVSVKEALRYLLEKNVQESGLWLQQDTDAHVTNNHYVYDIIGDTQWLEKKIDPSIPQPIVKTEQKGNGNLEFSWTPQNDEQNSLRIYIVPAGTAPENINEEKLAAIIQSKGHKFYESDPFIAAGKMINAAISAFGPDMKMPPESDWRGKRYMPWKLRMIRADLKSSSDCKPLTLQIPDGNSVYVSAATWYGEESPLLKVR